MNQERLHFSVLQFTRGNEGERRGGQNLVVVVEAQQRWKVRFVDLLTRFLDKLGKVAIVLDRLHLDLPNVRRLVVVETFKAVVLVLLRQRALAHNPRKFLLEFRVVSDVKVWFVSLNSQENALFVLIATVYIHTVLPGVIIMVNPITRLHFVSIFNAV